MLAVGPAPSPGTDLAGASDGARKRRRPCRAEEKTAARPARQRKRKAAEKEAAEQRIGRDNVIERSSMTPPRRPPTAGRTSRNHGGEVRDGAAGRGDAHRAEEEECTDRRMEKCVCRVCVVCVRVGAPRWTKHR